MSAPEQNRRSLPDGDVIYRGDEGRKEEAHEGQGQVDRALAVLDSAILEHKPSHVFALFSGGHDSLTATAITAKHPAFTAAVHINTGIGIEDTRVFVRETCERQGWPLLEYGPASSYEDTVLEHGFPGPAQHRLMYVRLKERSLDKLIRDHKRERMDRILLASGARSEESVRRMGTVAPVQRSGAKVWVAPIHDWSKADCHDLMKTEGLERNPVVDLIHRSGECLCGAFGSPGEMAELEMWFPAEAARLHDLERRAQAAGQIGCVWGKRPDDVHKDQVRAFDILPLCSSCQARAA